MTLFCFRTMLSPLTMLISQDCTWKNSLYISYTSYIKPINEIYHIYHRSVFQLFILVLKSCWPNWFWSTTVLQCPHYGKLESIYMLDLLKKVNADIPLFLSDNHGFPMSFLAGIPCLSERPRFGFSLHYWSQRSRTLIFQPRNLKRFTFRTF